MARRLTAEAGMMMPTYDSDGTFLPKVSGVQQLRMSLHERLCATTLLYLSRTRTPPSRSQHLDSCTLHDHVGARISLLGRGCGALSAARYYKTRKLGLGLGLYFTTLRTALHYHRYAADYVGKARAHRAGSRVRGDVGVLSLIHI